MKTQHLRAIITALLWGTLSTLHAQQRLVVIGEVKNVEEGTVFYLSETDGTVQAADIAFMIRKTTEKSSMAVSS